MAFYRSRPEFTAGNILRCLEQDQLNALHPSSRLTKRFITGGLSTAMCMHSRDIRGHHGCVNAVAFSNNDQELLITGGDDGRVMLWRVGELIQGKNHFLAMESLHESNIFSMAFSSDNTYIYSAGNDGKIKKHDIQSTKCLLEHTHEGQPAIYSLSAHPLSPDVLLSASEDAVSLVDTRLPLGPVNVTLMQSSSFYQSVCFNPVEPNLVAVGNSASGAALYDIRMRKKILVYEPTWNPLFQQDVVSVCFDRSGTRVLTLQRQLPPTVFNIWEGKALYQLADDTRSYRNSVTMKTGCFLGHSDEYVASGSDDFRCYIWKIPHGGTVQKGCETTVLPHLVLPGHQSIVNQVCYSSVHQVMCSSGVEKVFKLWSHLPLQPDDKICWSHDPPSRERHSLWELMGTEEGVDTSEEDYQVLAYFDAMIEHDAIMNGEFFTSDDSSSSSSQDESHYADDGSDHDDSSLDLFSRYLSYFPPHTPSSDTSPVFSLSSPSDLATSDFEQSPSSELEHCIDDEVCTGSDERSFCSTDGDSRSVVEIPFGDTGTVEPSALNGDALETRENASTVTAQRDKSS